MPFLFVYFTVWCKHFHTNEQKEKHFKLWHNTNSAGGTKNLTAAVCEIWIRQIISACDGVSGEFSLI